MRTPIGTLQVALLMLIAAGSLAADTTDADRQLAKQLATELKAALSTALQTSAESAIAICNERAPQIAMKIAQDNSVQVGRTALKVRSPSNAPTEWQRSVLLDFQNRLASGEALAAMEYATTVQVDGRVEHRYMKAIGVEPLCTTCHGTQIAPAVKQAIRAKYPADAATGFSVGDLRGAVYVVRTEGIPSNTTK
jgi:hypothetical protein